MRVLVTGGLGGVGRATLRELSRRGHRARALDLPGPPALGEVVRGDLRDPAAVARALEGCDAVVHDAFVLPPATDDDAEGARSVNVEGTRVLLEAMSRSPARLVFASSVAVHGSVDRTRPVRAEDPVVASDAYTRHKLACEQMIRASGLPAVILRVGVVLDPASLRADRATLREVFEIDPTERLETVHPVDVAAAQVSACEVAQAAGRTLLVAGGRRCRVRYADLFDALTDALGVEPLPRAAFGTRRFYTDWMDTAEGQAMLRYQTRTFADYRRDLAWTLRWARRAPRPLRNLARRALLAQSAPHRRARGGQPDAGA